MRNQAPEKLAASILEPSKSIEPAYASYTAITEGGKIITGVITLEAGASIRMMTAEGREQVLLRSDLDVLRVNKKSLMPEGFSQALPSAQDLADLIALIRSEQAAQLVQEQMSP